MLPGGVRSSGEHSLRKRVSRALLNLRMKLPEAIRNDYRIVAVLVVISFIGLLYVFFGTSGAPSSTVGQSDAKIDSSSTSSSSSSNVPPQSSRSLSPSSSSPSLSPSSSSSSSSSSAPPATTSANPSTTTTVRREQQEDRINRGNAMPERQEAVRKAMQHAWGGYVEHAWGRDELKPVSKTFQNWLDIGLTIIDALDTLWIMGLKDEFKKARDWVADSLSFDKNREVSTFETSIRVFGGLLSAYDLSKDPIFLTRAKDIGDRLLKAFEPSPLGLPLSQVHLSTGRAALPSWTGGNAILSELGTLQLEYVYLAKQLKKPEYAHKALNIFEVLYKQNKDNGLHGLYPVYVNTNTGVLTGHVTLGALGDSFFEYMLKMWFLTDKKVPKFREMYDESASSIAELMVKKTHPNKLWYFAELQGSKSTQVNPKMDELACFAAGGMFGYGAYGETKERDMKIAGEVASFCHEMWSRMGSGIAPEWVQCADNDLQPGPGGTHYLLRPETIETYFYMWRLTKDPKYREWAWDAFQAIEKSCKVPSGGYSGIRDVTNPTGGVKDDLQQSFFLAETLKYFYLVFSDDSVCDLNEVVFNTEAHPLSRFKEPISEWADLVSKFDPSVAA